MNIRRFFLVCLLGFAAQAGAQTGLSVLDGTLVRCGTEQAVIIENTVSKDGRYAAGWTLRPKQGKPVAVNWSTYRRDDPLAFVKKYGLNDNPTEDGDDPGKSGYALVNGVLDLRARTFTALSFESPYFPDKYRSSLTAAWSEDRHGTRYGVFANDVGSNHTDNTVDLALIESGPGGVQVTDLKPAADQAVTDFMRRRDPKDYRRYTWSFDFETNGQHDEAAFVPFRGNVLTVHFNAGVLLEPSNQDAGSVNFALPKGRVTGTAADKTGKP